MGPKGYTLIDLSFPDRFWPDIDLIIAIMEHIRLNLRTMEPRIAAGCEIVLLAAGTAHNVGKRPILALHTPPHVDLGLDWLELNNLVEAWGQAKSDDELREIGRTTPAPRWSELLASSLYPPCRGEP